MIISGKILAAVVFLSACGAAGRVPAQIDLPHTAVQEGRDSSVATSKVADAPVTLHVDLSSRMLIVKQGGTTIKTYQIAVGQDRYPTPVGQFTIRRIVWNPSWKPPPGAGWAKGKSAKAPGDPGNPMKVVKIFFHDPDYYIHGTGDVESLGSAASHGCLRMDPEDVADLAKLIMDHGGEPRGDNWFWRIIHFRRQEQVVSLDNPVSLVIEK